VGVGVPSLSAAGEGGSVSLRANGGKVGLNMGVVKLGRGLSWKLGLSVSAVMLGRRDKSYSPPQAHGI
jgi:hypothetical protein